MKFRKPDEILQILQNNGYEAYYVGGCVRDTLLQRQIHDWDITTSARPEEIMSCFEHCIPTGIRHGTVTVIENGVQAEVTTYRTDGTYSDSRHPEQVSFVRNLKEDLARRDFTINAMAMGGDGVVVDLYDGKKDLEQKSIRCVGDPDERFREDALRMLRAVRFSAQLGFEIESNTLKAIKRNASRCSNLSAERVREEMEKTLCSASPERLQLMARLGLLERCNPAIESSCAWIGQLPKDATLRWAALCRCWPEMKLEDLRLSKRITVDATIAAGCDTPIDEFGWKCLIAEHGAVIAGIVAALADKTELIEEVLSSGHCLSLQQLAVTGADFPALAGPALGAHLKFLLFHVLKNPDDNQKEILLKLRQ